MAERRNGKKTAYTIFDNQTAGAVQISDDVIATIGALAATEIEGVAALGGGITHDKAAKAGGKTLGRGIKVGVLEQVASVRIIVNMKYGYNIPDVCVLVQEKVKSAIENMTGLQVADVNVSVADVVMEKN